MALKYPLTPQHFQFSSYLKAMLIGGVVGLAAISVFIFGGDQPNPEWPEYWRVRPLLVTPLVSACGAAFFYFMYRLNLTPRWKAAAVSVGMMGFVVALWMGIVLGLAGTMWH